MKETVKGSGASAGVWKASKHRVIAGSSAGSDYVEATPDALWARTDPFGTYEPAGDRGWWSKQLPHETFMKLADLAPEVSLSSEGAKDFNQLVEVFANCYGLLGLLREDLGTPLLPGSGNRWFALIAPDAMIDETGRLQDIDAATDGKRLLEGLIHEHDRQVYAKRGELHSWKRKKLDITRRVLVWPKELRFQKPAMDFARSGLSWILSESNHDQIHSYEAAQARYGVRVVFDPWADAGISLVSTREPIRRWKDELRNFARDISWEDLDRRLEGGIRPRAIEGKDRRHAEHWYCASLLKAIYLMRYLDLNSGTRMRKCQATDCPEYFRVRPRSRRQYCPPPPGQKESKCLSRMTTARQRERKRRESDGA